MIRAVFLDRDGTINEEVSYLGSIGELVIFPTAAEAIRHLNESGFMTVIATNQSGVARGRFSEERLREINDYLKNELIREGAVIDAVYYCPHRPDDGCECRKPRSGMLERAARDHGIALGSSFMVGDRILDLVAGANVGCRTVLVLTGYGTEEANKRREMGFEPDFVSKDLLDAVSWILKQK